MASMRKRRFWKFAVLGVATLMVMHVYFNNEPVAAKEDFPKPTADFGYRRHFVVRERDKDLKYSENVSTSQMPTTTEPPVYGRNVSLDEALFRQGTERLVLVWRHPWGVKTEGVREGTKVDNCLFTYDKERIAEASAIIFHYSALDTEKMPWRHYRHPDQRYVFETLESPSYMMHVEHRSLREFDGGFINWTMSYHSKADVFAPYFVDREGMTTNGFVVVNNLVKLKSRLVLWVVSNCDLLYGSVARMNYARALAESGLDVSYYGSCFNNSDEYSNFNRAQHAQFKFYLSFENALHCDDYVTEKFWLNGLQYGRVPIVFGPSRATMERLAPRGSYIHAEDFESPEHLAAHIRRLDGNDAEYRRYFDWRVAPDPGIRLKLSRYTETREERLCRMLGAGALRRKSYHSMNQYVYASESEECLKAKVPPATTTVRAANNTEIKPLANSP